MKHFLFLVLGLGMLLSNVAAQNQKYHRIKATVANDEFQELMKAGLEIDHYDYKGNILLADVSDHDIMILKNRKVPFNYIIEDIQKNLNSYNAKIDREALVNPPVENLVTVPTPVHFGAGGSYGTVGGVAKHFTFAEMQAQLDQMRALYPDLITVKSSIGTTEQGRQLFMVKISDNADADENEPEVFLNAVHHAREPIGMTQLLFFMWHVLENYATDKEIQTLVNSTEIYIVPCVNPDGYEYNYAQSNTGGSMWRKNRHDNGGGIYGVDNNRNYGYGWGGVGASSSTSSDTYRGTSAFSELENSAIRNFCNSRQFVTEFNYHSYGNYCIYPYSAVSANNNPEIPLLSQLSTFFTEDNGFAIGNSQATVNYVASGVAEDWAYAEQTTKGKMYGFTPEVGNSSDGFYPAASRIIPLCNSMIVMNKNLLKVSTKYGLVTSTALSVLTGLNGVIPFNIKNFSIYPATYTVGLVPLSAYVTGADGPKIISSSTIFQTINNQFNFTLDAATPVGTNLDFVISTENGYHTRYDTISMQYTCAAPSGLSATGITTSTANLNWGAVAGATDYFVSSKLASSASWGAEVAVTASTTTTLTGLTPATAYNWRVRTLDCANYSAVQTFSTLQACGVPAPVASAITANGFTLSWPALSGAVSYTVQTRLQGAASWTSATVTTTNRIITGLAANTVYEFQVRTNCSSGSSPYSTVQTVTTAAFNYCTSSGNNNSTEWIDYVQLGTIARTSGREPGGYSNTGLSTNLVKGSSYTITHSAGFSGATSGEKWKIYIDFNNDGDFADGNETIVSRSTSGAGSFTTTFTVPTGAVSGSSRMRVKMSDSKINSPCGTFSYGEVEDYNIIITAANELEKTNQLPAAVLITQAVPAKTTESKTAIIVPSATVSPNPFADKIQVNLKTNGKQTVNTLVTLLSTTGKVVYSKLIPAATAFLQINTGNLPHGLYLLVINRNGSKETIKLIK
jgi:hypothetical protein